MQVVLLQAGAANQQSFQFGPWARHWQETRRQNWMSTSVRRRQDNEQQSEILTRKPSERLNIFTRSRGQGAIDSPGKLEELFEDTCAAIQVATARTTAVVATVTRTTSPRPKDW